jgi:hypothetical protein
MTEPYVVIPPEAYLAYQDFELPLRQALFRTRMFNTAKDADLLAEEIRRLRGLLQTEEYVEIYTAK